MEYLNPTAVAGMMGPRDMSMPGAGWGLLEGFQRQQDRNTAYQLMQMATDSQLLNQAQERFKFDSARQMQPLLYEQQGLQNTQLKRNAEKTGIENTNALDERTMRHLGFIANAAKDMMELEKKGDFQGARTKYDLLISQYRRNFPSAPLSLDDMNYQPGVTLPNLMNSLEGIKYWDLEAQTKKGLQDTQIQSNEKINNEDNVTNIITALIQAQSAQDVARISAQMTPNKVTMASLISEYMDTLEDPQKANSPRGKALIAWLPSMVAGMAQLKEAAKTQEAAPRASGTVRGQFEGIQKGAEAMRNPQLKGPTPAPTVPMPPQPPGVQGPVPPHNNESLLKDPDWDPNAQPRTPRGKEEINGAEVIFYQGKFARVRDPKTGKMGWVKVPQNRK